MISPRAQSLTAVLLCLATGWLTGCRTADRIGLTPEKGPDYKRLHLVYDLNGEFRSLPLDSEAPPRDHLQTVFERPPLSAPATAADADRWAHVRLSIAYPHPEGLPRMARATLRLSNNGSGGLPESSSLGTRLRDVSELFSPEIGGNSAAEGESRDDEIWVLDVPRQQLDLLLIDLAHSGYFDARATSDSGTRIEVEIDQERTQKNWTAEPRLDDFVSRVHREGRLNGFASPASAADRSRTVLQPPQAARDDSRGLPGDPQLRPALPAGTPRVS